MTHLNHTFALNIKCMLFISPFYYSSSNLPHNLYKKKLLFTFFFFFFIFFKLLLIFDLLYPLLFLICLIIFIRKNYFLPFLKTEAFFFKLLLIFDLFYPLLFLMKQCSHSLNVSRWSFWNLFPRILVAINDRLPIFGLWDFGI